MIGQSSARECSITGIRAAYCANLAGPLLKAAKVLLKAIGHGFRHSIYPESKFAHR